MQTPTLSKQQQKGALSSKSCKKKPEARIRNVYAQPYKPYWPILPRGSGEELEILLEKVLTPARKHNKESKGADFHKISDQHLKEKSNLIVEQSEEQKKLWGFTVRGINEVTRGLEHGTIGCVLLTEDANPQQMVTHIPHMCAISGVPVIILHFLRSVTKRTLGFSCIAFGFKKEAITDSENPFYLVCSKIQQLAETLPPPDPHMPLFNIDFEDAEEKHAVAEKALKSSPPEKTTALHLHRTSRKERKFVPSSSDVMKNSSDFIPLDFSDSTTMENEVELKNISKVKVHYQPLKVKRIQPNPRKLKRLKAK